ncbi:hypothetical protein NVS89_22390 [Ancylobacter sp. MQZ15Z-1]|uniref:Uncharacterized protein n=1 Tax=Ancylobacter mangrovi TaxID=2972472 RepID=A0A9X2T7V8_9HYPH|nr:hypothetical protein [Ancylobacter mangrovi]MCS0497844.1 hypothetical protein [Ancylobacter mangrovi]
MIFAAACAGPNSLTAASVRVPPAPAVCDAPPPVDYRTGEPLEQTVAKLAGERDAFGARLKGCREGWNAMAQRYRNGTG